VTFKRLEPSYPFPDARERDQEYSSSAVVRDGQTGRDVTPVDDQGFSIFEARGKRRAIPDELKDEDMLVASPVVYGYSLADKMWRESGTKLEFLRVPDLQIVEFNVEQISNVEWNDEAFEYLVLSEDRKDVVQALVRAHNQNSGFDDIVKGKGQGLIFNLFGPPGCGKTLTAEATSEHVRRPLCVVGAGDLGVSAAELDGALEKIFDMATTWNAIVLIDGVRKLITTYLSRVF
jgi:SpoVK/Ycf46/Vps4 family AAA+-type ATPase